MEFPVWFSIPPRWKDQTLDLILQDFDTRILYSEFETILENSDKFPKAFPVDTIRCKTLEKSTDKRILERNISSAYPLIHENVLYLCAEFLLFKRKHGSTIEKNLYKEMSLKDFLERILIKKSLVFVGIRDFYTLTDVSTGLEKWETIGTRNEKQPLILENCLSYDELKLASMISISSYSYFINDGSRKNHGKVEDRDNIEDEGIIVSIIAPRFVRRYVQDYPEIIIDKVQNTEEKIHPKKTFFENILSTFYKTGPEENVPTLRNIIEDFYQEQSFVYEDALKIFEKGYDRFTKLFNGDFFDNVMYEKRLTISFDTLLLEANYRARENRTTAYIHLVGIGLGAWGVSQHQEELYVNIFGKRLKTLGSKLSNISDINFSYFSKISSCANCKNGDTLTMESRPTGIKIHISNRNPFSKLSDEDKGKLLVVSYAADGNSLPGNEFWEGGIGNSSDSATASSSQISELHNPFINPLVTSRNLMVATCQGTIVTVQEYVKDVKAIYC